MFGFRTIEIDVDVHKKIEMERQSFSETPNDILRRVFRLDAAAKLAKPPRTPDQNGRPWTGKGVTLSHGTLCRMEYNGHRLEARIDEGAWVVDGKRYNSPSAAAGAAARTRSGGRPSLNGWIYWEVRRLQDKSWVRLDSLKPRVVALELSDF